MPTKARRREMKVIAVLLVFVVLFSSVASAGEIQLLECAKKECEKVAGSNLPKAESYGFNKPSSDEQTPKNEAVAGKKKKKWPYVVAVIIVTGIVIVLATSGKKDDTGHSGSNDGGPGPDPSN